ncbi:MAG: HAD hydrolase-like protein [Pseudomonadota bacterium]
MTDETILEKLFAAIEANPKGNLIFDFDGVVADTEPLHKKAYLWLLGTYGIDEKNFNWSSYVGNSERVIYEMLKSDTDVDLSIARDRRRRLGKVQELIKTSSLKPRNSILKILSSFSNPAYILSSQEKNFIDDCLTEWGISSRFEAVVSLADTNQSKADWLSKFSSRKMKVSVPNFYFEDNIDYLIQAKRLGYRTVFVTTNDAMTEYSQGDVEWTILES